MRKILKVSALALTLLFFGCVTPSSPEARREPSYVGDVTGHVARTAYTIEDLKRDMLKANGEIADLIPLLPKVFRENFVTVFKSRSLQEASYQNPRMILFNEDASLVLSFNGSPTQRGYEGLETMRFDYAKRDFIFEEISADQDAKERSQILLSAKAQSEEREMWENMKLRAHPNPESCLACHRASPRPNWEEYPFWQGVYGQVDDHIGLGTKEKAGFDAFWLGARKRSRYAAIGTEMSSDGNPYYISTHNIGFTQALGRLVFMKLAWKVTHNKDFRRYRLAIMATANLCRVSDFAKGISEPDLARMQRETKVLQLQASQATIDAIVINLGLGLKEAYVQAPNLRFNQSDERVGALQYVLAKMGIALDDYSMNFYPNSFTFHTPSTGIEEFYEILVADWHRQTGETLPNPRQGMVAISQLPDGNCANLKAFKAQ